MTEEKLKIAKDIKSEIAFIKKDLERLEDSSKFEDDLNTLLCKHNIITLSFRKKIMKLYDIEVEMYRKRALEEIDKLNKLFEDL